MAAPGSAQRAGSPPFRSRGGFSLTELLLVVVILGILAAAGLPRIGVLTSKEKATRAAQVMQADMERAFALAARRRQPVRLSFNSPARRYEMLEVASGTVLFTRFLDSTSDFGVETMTASRDYIDISPSGIASDTMNVIVTSRGTTREVRTTRVGLVRRVR